MTTLADLARRISALESRLATTEAKIARLEFRVPRKQPPAKPTKETTDE